MAEKIKVLVDVMLKLANALNSGLDGVRKGKDTIEPFVFEYKVGWNLAKNADILESHRRTHNKLTAALLKKHKLVSGEKLNEANRDRIIAMSTEDADNRSREIEISGILFVSIKDLFNEREETIEVDGESKTVKVKNNIPQSVLTALMPIIKSE